MRSRRPLRFNHRLLLPAILSAASATLAEDLPKTLMTRRGELLASEDFIAPLPPSTGTPKGFASGFSGWRFNNNPKAGKWEQGEGIFKGMELKESHHPATASYGMKFKDAIIQCDVRLDNVPADGRPYRTVFMKLTDEKDYVCSLSVGPGGAFLTAYDAARINPKTHQRERCPPVKVLQPVKLDVWHTLVLEVKGEEVVGTLDGRSITVSNALIGTEKHSVMIGAGTQGSFRNFRVWEALPSADWPKNKAAISTATGRAELHIAPGGDDAHAGSASAPFASLERARDEIRTIKKTHGLPAGGVTIVLHGGLYEMTRTFELNAADSGGEVAPIVYRAREGDEVRLSGGRRVTAWKPVVDAAVLERLDPVARGRVMQADLSAFGVKDYGQIGGGFNMRGGPGLELFFDDEPMTLSRFPNEGFIKITDVEGPTEVAWGNSKGRAEGIVLYEGDRPERWKNEKEPWALGYWFHDWAEQRQRIESIDPAVKRMTLAKPYHHYGYRKGRWFYGFNLLCEIDRPGEWHLDRQAGVVYFWPPSPVDKATTTVSVLDSLVSMNSASHVTLRGLTFEAVRGTAVKIEHALHNQVVGCTLRNIGSWAVSISGEKSAVIGCDITATGDGGIRLDGGDRRTLTPAGLVAENNHIHHWSRWNRMNRHGIALSGVGNRAAHNLLHDSPHSAITFGGNDHVIEFNEIHNVCLESNDAGAIYAGRNWTMRGTVIRHNYLHHIHGFENRGCIGIYLDDLYSGTSIFGNVFCDVTRAAYIGGGHDNRIENNLFVDCKPAVHVDSRGLGWAFKWPAEWIKEGREKKMLSGVRYNQPPYSQRYPELVTILDKDPAAPTGSLIARNVQIGGEWDEVDKQAAPFVTFQDNLPDAALHFGEAGKPNLQLPDDSPAYKLGFKRIPVEKIGLIHDETRASRAKR